MRLTRFRFGIESRRLTFKKYDNGKLSSWGEQDGVKEATFQIELKRNDEESITYEMTLTKQELINALKKL